MIYAIARTFNEDGYLFRLEDAIEDQIWFIGFGANKVTFRYRNREDKVRQIKGTSFIIDYIQHSEMYLPNDGQLQEIELIPRVQYESLREFGVPEMAVYRRGVHSDRPYMYECYNLGGARRSLHANK